MSIAIVSCAGALPSAKGRRVVKPAGLPSERVLSVSTQSRLRSAHTTLLPHTPQSPSVAGTRSRRRGAPWYAWLMRVCTGARSASAAGGAALKPSSATNTCGEQRRDQTTVLSAAVRVSELHTRTHVHTHTALPSRATALRRPPPLPTFFIRVAISLLRLLFAMRAFSAVRCLRREFCLASTTKAAVATRRCCCGAAEHRQAQCARLEGERRAGRARRARDNSSPKLTRHPLAAHGRREAQGARPARYLHAAQRAAQQSGRHAAPGDEARLLLSWWLVETCQPSS